MIGMGDVFGRWGEYTEQIEKFAVYPEAGTGSIIALAYCALGLVDEWFEFDEARDRYVNEPYVDEKKRKAFVAELGDFLWYIGRAETELEAAQPGVVYTTTMTWHQGPAVWSVVTEEAHAIAGRVKKLLRGDKGDFQLQTIANHLISLRNEILGDSELAVEAMDYNVAKLTDRLERNVIKGDGDYR